MIKDFIFSLIQQHGYPILFWGLAAEYLGFPFIPGEAMMSFVGFLGLKETGAAALYAIIYATAGTFTGSMIAWYLGYKFGENFVLKIGKPIHITRASLDKTALLFDKHRIVLILFGKFVPGLRHVIPYLSGISKINVWTYTVLNLISSVVWCSSFILTGTLLGEKWKVIVNLVKAYSLVLILLFIFILLVVKYFKNHQRIIFTIAFPFLLFIKLSEDVIKQELTVFDDSIYSFIARFISEDMTDLMKFLTFLGSGPVLITLTIIIILALHKYGKKSYYGWIIGINLIASTLLNETFKVIFQRQRPDLLRLIDITGYSFPSGHSMISLSYYGLLAYILWKNVKSSLRYPVVILSVILIISIGISRIYLGVHYASDVLGGFSAGLAWLAVFIVLSNRFQKNR